MALRTYVRSNYAPLPKATLEDAADPFLGWTAQHDTGPTNTTYVYATYKPGQAFDPTRGQH